MRAIYICFVFAFLSSCVGEHGNKSIPVNSLIQPSNLDSLSTDASQATKDYELSAVPIPKGDFIKYGTSFGQCSGYCFSESTIEESRKTTIVKSGIDTLKNPTKIVAQEMSKNDWTKFLQSFNFDAFKRLPEVIGCPDCADGGASWLEISKSGSTHKVTFEYRYPPKKLSKLVELLSKHNNT